jgi:small-conductance mechanosensitive channel
MIETMRVVLEALLGRLRYEITTYLPAVLAALVILLGAYLAALVARWVLNRIFKGVAADRFLRRSGLAFLLDGSGRLRATRIVAETVYWLILLAGFLTALSAFNTDLTTQMLHNFVLLIPKLAVAGVILLAGFWSGHYLGRSALVWSVNENLPHPRRIAGAVRVVIMFVAVVAAADYLDFARSVFLAAFVILLGGAALATSLALGLGGRDAARRYLEDKAPRSEEERPRSLWNHL